MEKAKKLYPLLDGLTVAESKEEVNNAMGQIKDLGGVLLFNIEKFSDGWSAQCKQVPGIITGGTNPEPTESEMEFQIRDAIHSALNLRTKLPYETLKVKTEIMELSLSI